MLLCSKKSLMKETGKVNYGLVLGVIIVVVAIVGVAAFAMKPAGPAPTTTTIITTTTAPTTTTPTTKNLIFQLDWMPGGQHLPFFVAQKMFWKESGLNVEIIRGSGSADTARKVGLRAVDFGYSAFDPGTMIKCTELLPIKAIWSGNLKNDIGLFYVVGRDAGRGIVDKNDLTTLQGKILGEPAWSASTLQLPAFLVKVGLAPDAVTRMHIDPGASLAALIRGDSDLHGVGLGEEIEYNKALSEEGLTGDVIWFKDYGLIVLGDTLWTSEKLINDDPVTVRKFVEGLQKAFVWVNEHPQEAAKIMSDAITTWKGLEQTLIDGFIGRYKNTMDKEVNAAHGVGYMPPDLVKESVANSYIINNIGPDFQLANPLDVMTNDFVNPSIYPTTYLW